MIPMSVNSVDGKVSVIYFDATVTMNGKEFTSRKIIPINTLKKDEKRNRISTEAACNSLHSPGKSLHLLWNGDCNGRCP
mgnify:CR=1 FL=1